MKLVLQLQKVDNVLMSLIASTNPLDHIRELSSRLMECLQSDRPLHQAPVSSHQLKTRDSNTG